MPHFEYSKWDGSQEFRPQSAESLFDTLSEYVLNYGENVLHRFDELEPEQQDLLDLLVKEGYIERDEKGQYRVSPKGIRRVEEKALHDLFQVFNRDTMGKHDTGQRGAGQVKLEDSKPYEYGDSLANLNLHETLRNALIRQQREGQPAPPIHIGQDDFVVYETEYQTKCATVVLLDMSGSMGRYGKFYHAKKVAMGLQALVRGRYPEDFLQVIGFYTYASPLSERELIQCAPKPVSIFNDRVLMRISLDRPPNFVPEHFTNIQAGLRFARRALSRQPCQNKQIIVVTDGEPTAHLEQREIVLIYPPAEKTARRTLEEVVRCSSEGIHISAFALIEDYFYLGLVNFVEEMAKVSRGVAAYCTAGQLGRYVLDSFQAGHRARRVVG
jgi:Ca-activated chloride channel homolog